MLILTRRISTEERPESLFIGDDIEVIILGVKGNQVRIGINAPKETPILRDDAIVKKEKTA